MRRFIGLVSIAALLTFSEGSADDKAKRRIPCRVPANSSSCYWTHGRLSFYSGTPSFRLWKIGTHRVLGIYSGPSVDLYGLDNESPEFPPSIYSAFALSEHTPPYDVRIFGDFEVCPLEPETAGKMQAACIESADKIFAAKLN
jgi:hypothetical protein